jgi:hypothetical protein
MVKRNDLRVILGDSLQKLSEYSVGYSAKFRSSVSRD